MHSSAIVTTITLYNTIAMILQCDRLQLQSLYVIILQCDRFTSLNHSICQLLVLLRRQSGMHQSAIVIISLQKLSRWRQSCQIWICQISDGVRIHKVVIIHKIYQKPFDWELYPHYIDIKIHVIWFWLEMCTMGNIVNVQYCQKYNETKTLLCAGRQNLLHWLHSKWQNLLHWLHSKWHSKWHQERTQWQIWVVHHWCPITASMIASWIENGFMKQAQDET